MKENRLSLLGELSLEKKKVQKKKKCIRGKHNTF